MNWTDCALRSKLFAVKLIILLPIYTYIYYTRCDTLALGFLNVYV